MRGIKLVFIGGHFEFCEMEKILGMFSSLQKLSLHYITRLEDSAPIPLIFLSSRPRTS